MSSGRLLDDTALAASAVVANNTMNRERGLAGPNSYAKELGFDPYEFLAARQGAQAWLDLCCGSGKALIYAAGRIAAERPEAAVTMVGIDLVDHFMGGPRPPGLELIAASVADWSPRRSFDLITCVHGLHYVGDKLRVLERAASWLVPDGLLVADFDAESVRDVRGRSSARRVASAVRRAGWEYDTRRKRVSCLGPCTLNFEAAYLGADDAAGPNYTGQPAVASYYEWSRQ
ncbi:class I SAM-dependent methyltransferase [Actinospica robiniae]|uniref:class I SAM-dependent methyltransferase n=1 Tax=Actinospica robiniae TaxID=304901 RepID=UPI0003FBC693|nr:class I SAM-dependent methyltransferase [Actinospica robiniae]